MRKGWKRITAIFLALVMMVPSMPVQALAAMDDNDILAPDTVYDEDIDQAKEDIEVLEAAGIADETGSMVDLDIREDGKRVELSDLTNRIASGKTVGAITVNGKHATPDQILKIGQVQSELELAKLLDEDIEITDEHVENLESLITGIADGSIDMDEAIENGMVSLPMTDSIEELPSDGSGLEPSSGTMETTADGKYTQPYINESEYESSHEFDFLISENKAWYSKEGTNGIGLDGIVTLSCEDTVESGATLTVTATLNKAQSVPVSFDWSAAAGSLVFTGNTSGTITWDANDTEDKTFTVTVAEKDADDKWNGSRAFVINVGNVQNALIAGNTYTWSKTVTVSASDGDASSYTESGRIDASSVSPSVSYQVANDNGLTCDDYYTAVLSNNVNFIPSGVPIRVTVNSDYALKSARSYASFSSLESSKITIGSKVFSNVLDQNSQSSVLEVSAEDLSSIPANTSVQLKVEMKIKYHYTNSNAKGTKDETLSYVRPQYVKFTSVVVEAPGYSKATNVSVPAGTYYSGQTVPVTVTLNNYARATTDAKLKVNNVDCPLLDAAETSSKKLTFGYTVADDDTSTINVTGVSGLAPYDSTGDNSLVKSFGTEQGVTLVSDVKRSGLDLADIKYGIDDSDPGMQVVTVLIPFKTDAIKNWIVNENLDCTANGQGIALPVPGYANATASSYLAGAYFSYDGGTTRYPVYVVDNGTTEAVALATRFVPPVNEDVRLRKDTLDLFFDPVLLSASDQQKYLPAWSDKKTGEGGYAYFEGGNRDAASAFIGKNYTYYFKGGVMFDPDEYTTRLADSYDVNDQEGVAPGFLKLKNNKGYVLLQDKEHPENQYDVELVVNEAWYNAYIKGVRAEDPGDLTISYQCSDRKDFSFKDPKYFTWECYRVDTEEDDSTVSDNNIQDEPVSDVIMATVEMDENGVGNILFTGEEGHTRFILNIKNGAASRSYKLSTKGRDLTVLEGKTPFLNIPSLSRVKTTLTNADTDVLFSSNVTARNAALGQGTTFTVKLYKDSTLNVEPSGEPAWTSDFVSTKADTITHITVPGEQIGTPGTYAVVISTTYAGGVVIDKDTERKDNLTATAYLQVKQAPAKVTLDELDSYSVTSDAIPAITYSVTPAAAMVEYTIQKSGGVVGTMQTGSDGSITFSPEVPTGLKEAYTITVYARNNNDEPWSVDSMLLTVYNKDILDIIVKDVTAGEIGGSTGGTGASAKGTTIAMDNHDKLSGYGIDDDDKYQLTFEDFNILRTDMSLQKVISANYGSGAWGMISDKMNWTSSDPDTVSVDYKQGGIYSDIRNYNYVSYAPATDFLMVGKNNTAEDNSVTITATHANTGLSASFDVTTKTLTDELYVFQFYPKVATTVIYKNNNNVTRNLTSNGNGELAVYEPDGINSTIMATSTYESDTYVGTLYPSELVSGERDIASLQLYPCNNLRLRRIAGAELTVLMPDGSPYNGDVKIRAGVYKNGVYCPGAEIKTAKTANGQDGKTDVNAHATNGRLNLWFDPRQFNNKMENDVMETDGLLPGDTVTYVIEYRVTDYQPGYVTLNAVSNHEGAARSVDSVIQLRNNVGSADLPQIMRQTLQQYDKDGKPTSYTRDVTDYTEDVGISTHFNKAELITDAALTDAAVSMDGTTGYATCSGNSISSFAIYTTEGKALTGQEGGNKTEAEQILKLEDLTKNTALYVFPFSSTAMGRGVYTMTDTNMKNDGITDQGSSANYSARVKMHFVKDGLTTKEETLPFGVSNLSHQKDLSQTGAGAEEIGKQVKNDIRNTVDIGSIFEQVKVNEMIQKGFVFLSGLSGAAGDNMMNMMILPTEDPSSFRIMVFIGYNKKNDREDGNEKLSINYDPDALYDDAQNFEKELDEMFKDDDDDDSSGEGSLDFNFYGTLMLDARLGISDGNWDIRFAGGNVGTNVEGKYEWSQNFMCGPYPIVISFETGFNADIEVAFGDKNGVKAMLLDAAMGLSIEAFAGLGFDLSLIEFKLGIFGKIGADVDFVYLAPQNKTGTKLDIDGKIGLKMEVKVLLVTYEKEFCSTGFGWTKKWNKYDEIKKAWETENFAELSGLTSSGRNYNMYLMPNGTAFVEIDGEGEIENRDYLELADRAWSSGSSGGGRRLLRAAAPLANALNNVQTNAYPYANPVFVDDGSMFLYISDNNNPDEPQSVVSYAVRNGSGYDNRGALGDITADSDGDEKPDYIFADSDVVASGSGSNVFAAWVKQLESPEKEMKDKATYDDLGMMMNATEIYAGVYDGSQSDPQWTTTRLTENTVADMAPTVASSGTKAIVAWRSLAATELPADGAEQDITASFNAENYINYRIYNGSNWSDATVAYNGAAGTVNAIDSAMLSDGTALLTYTVRTGDDVTSTETFYTLIGSDGNVVTTGRLTNNDTIDTNAQVSAVNNQFVVGWYSEYETGEESEVPDLGSSEMGTEKVLAHDIRLARINANGSIDADFPESIGGEAGSGISSDFRFSAPAGNADIDKLSVVWSEKNEEDKYELNAVRFYTDGGNIGVTTQTDVAKTETRCAVDRFDTYTDADGKVYTLLLCSDYSSIDGLSVYDTIDLSEQGLTVLNGENNAEPSNSMLTVLEQDPIVNIMLGSGTFPQSAIEVEAQTVMTELTAGLNQPVQFAVKNVGVSTISSVNVSLGNENKTFNNLSLLPGESTALVLEYPVPETVADVDYTVTADSTGTANGTLVLNRPDVGISGIKILNEVDKKRDIQVTLHNRSGIPLVGSGKKVKLAFYKDSAYSDQIGATVDIDESTYADIDGGFGTYTQSLNVSDIIGASAGEIPDEGVSVYARAWVEEAALVEGKPVVVEELYPNDNESMISFKGLLTKYGEKLTMDGVLIPGENGKYTIEADVRNNSLQTVYLNEIKAKVLDAEGRQIGEDIQLTGESKLDGEKRMVLTKELESLAGDGESTPASVEIEAVPASKLAKPNVTRILKDLIDYESGRFITQDSGIEGYEFYAGTVAPENSDDEKGTIATDANVNVADYDLLTNIVDKENTFLYARAKTTYKISDWVKIPLPGRQNAENIGADYYTDRLIGIRDGVNYSTDGSIPSNIWSSTTDSTDLTKAPVEWNGAAKTLMFLIPGDNDKQLFPSTVKTVTLGVKGAAPAGSNLQGLPIEEDDISFRTAKLPTLKTGDGETGETGTEDGAKKLQYRYKRHGDSDWSTWGSVSELIGLDIATTYDIELRYAPEADSNGKLTPASLTFSAGYFTTKTTSPDINDILDRWIDYKDKKFKDTQGVFEYAMQENAASGTQVTDTMAVPEEEFYIRYRAAGNSTEYWTKVNPQVPDAVSGVEASNETLKGLGGKLTNTTTSMEYRYKADDNAAWTEWTACKGSSVDKLPPGTYQVRNKKSGSDHPSFANELTITPGQAATVTVDVKDSNKETIRTATVKVVPVGGQPIYKTLENGQDIYTIVNLSAGTHSIIVTGEDGKQVTALVDIDSEDESVEVTLPTGHENSSKLVDNTGYGIHVGGIDEQARTEDKKDSSEWLLTFKAEDINASEFMNEEEGNETDTGRAVVKINEDAEKDSGYIKDGTPVNIQSDFMDLSLEKTLITPEEGSTLEAGETEIITQTGKVMEIILPYPQIDSRFGIQVRRYHAGLMEKFSVLNARPASTSQYRDKTYVIDRLNKRIYIYSNCFSVYAISYTEDSAIADPTESPSSGGGGGGGGGGAASGTCTVSFDMRGHGSQIEPQTVNKNEKAIRPEDPEDTGFAFEGWYTDYDCTSVYDFSTPVTEDLRLYAKWNKVNTYTVTFHSDLGAVPEAQTVNEGMAAAEPDALKEDGWVFRGWYMAGAKDKYDFETPVTGDLDLYAKWEEVPEGSFTVTFDNNGHGKAPDVEIVAGGQTVKKPEKLSAEGYRFTGWFTDKECTKAYDFDTPVTANIILYAGWKSAGQGELEIYFDDQADDPYEGIYYNSEEDRYEIVYTGSAITPLIRVRSDNTGELKEGIDYKVSYSNNTKVSTKKPATITVKGKGTYTDKKVLEFHIIPADLKKAKDKGLLVMADELTVETGKKLKPVLVYRGKLLKASDCELSNKGGIKEAATVDISGKGNFTGKLEGIPVRVLAKKEIKSGAIKVTLKAGKKTYNGTAQELSVTTAEKTGELSVTAGSSKSPLTEGKDFVVAYSNNTDAGKASVIITGIGSCNGTIVKTFKIDPDKTSGIKAELSDPDEAVYYTAGGAMPDVTVTAAGTGELAAGRDYTITYSSNKKVGKGFYTVKFLGNYKGHKAVKGSFEIKKAPMDEAEVISPQMIYNKPGKYLAKPYVSIDGVQVKGSEYTVKYYEGVVTDVTAAGVKELTSRDKLTLADGEASKIVTVAVTAKGKNYEGTALGTYEVVKSATGTIDLSKAKIVAAGKDTKGRDVKPGKLEYTGGPIEPEVRVLVRQDKTWKEVDPSYYSVSYINNINKGKSVILVNGDGDNAIGSKSVNFTITTMRMSLFKLIFGK